MGGCQDYGPFLGTLNNRCSAILRDHNFDNHPYSYMEPLGSHPNSISLFEAFPGSACGASGVGITAIQASPWGFT